MCINRGGVLEPEGTVEIKFKSKDLVKAMSRLDATIHHWNRAVAQPELSPEEQANIRKKIKERQELLMPIYHQVRYNIVFQLFPLTVNGFDNEMNDQEKIIIISRYLNADYITAKYDP